MSWLEELRHRKSAGLGGAWKFYCERSAAAAAEMLELIAKIQARLRKNVVSNYKPVQNQGRKGEEWNALPKIAY